MMSPCIAVILVVFFQDSSGGAGISQTELFLGLGYFLANSMLSAARHGFTSAAVFDQQLRGPAWISHELDDRSSLKRTWLDPSIAVLRQEVHFAGQRLGIQLSAQWFIARQSMLPAILAMLEPSIAHATALKRSQGASSVQANYVSDDTVSGGVFGIGLAQPEAAGVAGDAAAKGAVPGKSYPVDTTNPMVGGQGFSRQNSFSPSSPPGTDSSSRRSPVHAPSSVEGVYSVLGKEVVFSLEALVVSAASRSQPASSRVAIQAAAAVAAVCSGLHYVAFFSQGQEMDTEVLEILSRVLLYVLCCLMHWNVLVYLIVAVVDYRRRRLMSSSLTAVLQGPCFGTPIARHATQDAIEQAVEAAVQSGSVRDMLSTSGLPAFNPFNVGAAPPRPSQARASLAQQATDHLLSLPLEKRLAIQAEIVPFVYPSLPLVDLSRPENAVAWIRARSLVTDFGSMFFLRIQLAVTILGIYTLWLVIASVSLIVSHGVNIGEGLRSDALYIACMVNVVLMSATLVTCMANGAYCNNDLTWQADQLSKTALSTSQLSHSLRVLHRISADGQVMPGVPAPRSNTFNRPGNPQVSKASLAHMEGAQDSSGLSAEMLLAHGSAVHLWREAFASTLLARISRIVSTTADGRALLEQLGVKGCAALDPVDTVLQQESTVRLSQTAVLRLLTAVPMSTVRMLLADLELSQQSLVAVRDVVGLYVRTHRLRILGLPATDTSAGYTLGALACMASVFLHAVLSHVR